MHLVMGVGHREETAEEAGAHTKRMIYAAVLLLGLVPSSASGTPPYVSHCPLPVTTLARVPPLPPPATAPSHMHLFVRVLTLLSVCYLKECVLAEQDHLQTHADKRHGHHQHVSVPPIEMQRERAS